MIAYLVYATFKAIIQLKIARLLSYERMENVPKSDNKRGAVTRVRINQTGSKVAPSKCNLPVCTCNQCAEFNYFK